MRTFSGRNSMRVCPKCHGFPEIWSDCPDRVKVEGWKRGFGSAEIQEEIPRDTRMPQKLLYVVRCPNCKGVGFLDNLSVKRILKVEEFNL